MVAIKRGPLTREELMLLWASVTDDEYNQPLIEKEDSNIEAIEQAAEQFARVSQQIDNNTQAMFILPWSGQTAPPSQGAAPARTTLTVTRTGNFDIPLVFVKDDLIIQHRLNDFGVNGSVDITTNRLYAVEFTTALGPGEAGPIELEIVSLNEGPGYNEATPDTLKTILQPGVGFQNNGATVINQLGATNRVVATIFPDVPITGHIGQYLLFTEGANIGQLRRIVGIENPDPSIPHGGIFNVSAEAIVKVALVAGIFSLGERVLQPLSGAEGVFLSLSNERMVITRTNGTFNGSDPLEGEFGATANAVSKEQDENLITEVGTAGWKIVSWTDDLKVNITNEEQPTGGVCGFLDELGNERGLPRLIGEGDDEYRRRIAVPADVVSPAAVIRAGNKIVEPYDESVCLREVGRPLFQGMFFDAAPNEEPFVFDLDLVEMDMFGGNQVGANFVFFDDSPSGFFDDPSPQTNLNFFSTSSVSSLGDAFGSQFIPGEIVSAVDTNGIITQGIAHFDFILGSTQRIFRGVTRVNGPGFINGAVLRGHTSGFQQAIVAVGQGLLPQHRFYTMLSIREFRGFFIVGVPRIILDDFGIFYDFGPDNAFDTNTVDNFFDGAAIGSNSLYSRIYDAIDGVRPAGVPFNIYIEEFGCV